MSYRNIHQKIIDVLGADSELSDLIQQINYSHTNFEGFPAIAVANSSNSNDYQSNESKTRTYGFSVFVYDLFTEDSEYEQAVKNVEDGMDRVIEIFNKSNALNPDATMVMPVPSSVMNVQAGDEGVYCVGEVVVECKVHENC